MRHAIAGRNFGFEGHINTSFWDMEVSGSLNMCGSQVDGAVGWDDSFGKIAVDMQTGSTFLHAGWNFVDETDNGSDDIWWINEGLDYPRLARTDRRGLLATDKTDIR